MSSALALGTPNHFHKSTPMPIGEKICRAAPELWRISGPRFACVWTDLRGPLHQPPITQPTRPYDEAVTSVDATGCVMGVYCGGPRKSPASHNPTERSAADRSRHGGRCYRAWAERRNPIRSPFFIICNYVRVYTWRVHNLSQQSSQTWSYLTQRRETWSKLSYLSYNFSGAGTGGGG